MILTLCEISLFHGTGSCNRGAGGGSTLPFGVESLQYTVESNDSTVRPHFKLATSLASLSIRLFSNPFAHVCRQLHARRHETDLRRL